MNVAKRDANTNTHEMPFRFNPENLTMFSIKQDDEWDQTHYTFVTPGGVCFRMPRDAVRIVCERPAEVPSQPPVGYGVHFEDGTEWMRYDDGYWHTWGADRIEGYDHEANAQTWEDLWTAHGTVHWRGLCPIRPDQVPWLIDRNGPIGSAVMPEMVEGEPAPGHVAWMTDDSSDVHIRDVKANTEVVLSGASFMSASEMFIRTMWKRTGGAAEDTTIPNDVSSLDSTTEE